MISYKEMPEMLSEQFPEIRSQIQARDCYGSVYLQLTKFATFTRTLIEEKNFLAVRQCFGLADLLYKQGDIILSNAIENVYVYSLHLDYDPQIYRLIQPLLPEALFQCYRKQILASFP